MQNKKLDVYISGKQVGTLAETPEHLVAFQYSDDWIKTGFDISPFSLPLQSGVFVPKESRREIFNGLFGIFADSLPDAWGQLLLDRYLSSIGINSNDISILDRLAYVGNTGIGALEYYPAQETDFNISGYDYDTIARACENILSSKPTEQIDLLYHLGGSSGGTRPKIFIAENNKEWIVKFPSNKDPLNPLLSGKMEYDYSNCAKKCGIKMTQTELLPSKICEGFFRTVRFDRNEGKKIFTATVSSLLEVDFRAPSCDYETYMKLIQILTNDNKKDKEMMYRQMCFNVLSHNRDDHTKNFSFIYTDTNGWRLAPAYDITYSNTYFGEQTTAVNGKGKSITDKDFYTVGINAGLPKTTCIDILKDISDKINANLSKYLSVTKPSMKRVKTKELLNDFDKNANL